MPTTIRELDGLPIEEPVLDEEGVAKQQALADTVLHEYDRTHTLTGIVVREQVEAYESEISDHLADRDDDIRG